RKPWQKISSLLEDGASVEQVEAALEGLDPAELLHTVFSLSPDDQRALLSILPASRATSLLEDLPDAHVADLIEDMSPDAAADIVEGLASDHRADVLGELDDADADAIIAELDDEDASEVRELIAFNPDQAGGLMMTEFAAYPMASTVRSVVDDLMKEDRDYSLLTVHYIYVVVKKRKLKGVIRIRDLVFADPDKTIGELARPALTVAADARSMIWSISSMNTTSPLYR
ncbi:MAG: hypothetical protein O2907_10585, partial [Proteobacteria bacterium]|nr:hypothetical protein [Pseudomonadota bacterium]